MKLTNAEVNQLLSYIDTAEEEGWYYGNKEHFKRRHEIVKAFVKTLLRYE